MNEELNIGSDAVSDHISLSEWITLVNDFQKSGDARVGKFVNLCNYRVRVNTQQEQNGVWKMKSAIFDDTKRAYGDSDELDKEERLLQIKELAEFENTAVNGFDNYFAQDLFYLTTEEIVGKYVYGEIPPKPEVVESWFNFVQENRSDFDYQMYRVSLSKSLTDTIVRKIHEVMNVVNSTDDILVRYNTGKDLYFLKNFLGKWVPTGLFTKNDIATISIQIGALDGVFKALEAIENTEVGLSDSTKDKLKNLADILSKNGTTTES